VSVILALVVWNDWSAISAIWFGQSAEENGEAGFSAALDYFTQRHPLLGVILILFLVLLPVWLSWTLLSAPFRIGAHYGVLRGCAVVSLYVGIVCGIFSFNQTETDYESSLRKIVDSVEQATNEQVALQKIAEAFAELHGQAELSHTFGATASESREQLRQWRDELKERADKRHSTRITFLLIAGVFVISAAILAK